MATRVEIAVIAAAALPATPRAAPLAGYGLLGMPLAFAALPVYVHWPALANAQWGLPLAGLGALLLVVRIIDAAVDPLVGRLADRWFARGVGATLVAMAVGGSLMLMGMVALFVHRPMSVDATPWIWAMAAAALLVTSLGFSVAQITHQAWGARLASPQLPASTWIAAREAAALAGVLAGSVLPPVLGWRTTLVVLALLLAAGLVALRLGRVPGRMSHDTLPSTVAGPTGNDLRIDAPFRRLLGVHALNGIASAVPATLIAFYVADVLGAAGHLPWLLLTYFVAAGASTPLWAAAVRRAGCWRCWGAAMALGLAAFGLVFTLGHGDVVGFFVVCIATGVAFGGETIASQACLVQHVEERGAARHGGASFGWWAMVAKLNLALAAGLALPLLGAAGYVPGAGGTPTPLVLGYAVLPCALKLAALALWWRCGGAVAVAPGASLRP